MRPSRPGVTSRATVRGFPTRRSRPPAKALRSCASMAACASRVSSSGRRASRRRSSRRNPAAAKACRRRPLRRTTTPIRSPSRSGFAPRRRASGRVWADGNLIDLSSFTTRFYSGGDTQTADPLIEEIEGAGNVPAYRGLAYIVFEDMPLAQFGNRIPQLQFEVLHSLAAANPDALENRLPGVALIPGAGEFVYATSVVTQDDGMGTTAPENAHNASATSDLDASLDELQALAPNLKAVSLVVGWFGSDLRAGNCTVKPGVEVAAKTTYPQSWSVNGVLRNAAHLVSQIGGRPAYGGTPTDDSVVAAIQDLKARGLRVQFCPFLFMDIAAGNTLPDPYSNASTQAAYPWRGRITCSPAPGVSASPDQSAAAATQVAAFFGSASVANFSVSGTRVAWTGGTDWGYRRMIL